ncbi:3-hydroxy acid dehydrogenase [Acrasis kona]|uniref:3-hydroxy acid dehydrogenase n=1 Tax=Acrasis kona TaxID=1008807 RepID=A0AAW2Z709_9EUKA
MSYWLLSGVAVLVGLFLYVIRIPSLKKDIAARKKAVLVTGAASGIGLQTCNRLLKDGAFVFACDLNMDALKKAYQTYPSTRVCLIKMDVTLLEDIKAAYNVVVEELKNGNEKGHINSSLFGLVNCAGIAPLTKNSLVEKQDEEVQKIYAVNVFGIERCTRIFYPLLESQQNSPSSCVINIASVCGIIAFPFFSHYSATKVAVVSYSASLRREFMRKKRVRVTCICPGFTNTPIITSCGDKGTDQSAFKDEIKILESKHLDLLWSPRIMQKPDRVANYIVDCIFSTNNKGKVIVDHFHNRVVWFFLYHMEPWLYDVATYVAYKLFIRK